MKDKKGEPKKKSVRIRIVVLFLFIAIIFASARYFNLLNGQLYHDRTTLLMEIDSKVAAIIEAKINATWNDVYTAEYELMNNDVSSVDTLVALLADIDKVYPADECHYMAFDDLGNFYSSDGKTGCWNDMDMLAGNVPPQQTSVVVLPYDKNREYIMFLKKLDTEIPLDASQNRVTFLAVVINMKVVEKDLNVSVFGDSCFIHIVDENGRRLYKSANENNFIDGYNIIDSLSKFEFRYDQAADMLNVCKSEAENVALEFVYENSEGEQENWFVSSALVPSANWNVLLFVPTNVLGAQTTMLMKRTIIYFTMIAVSIGVLFIMLAYISSSRYHEKELRERQEEANRLLEKAIQEAKDANLAKTKFLSHMSHDIRTPINGIMGMTGIAIKYIANRDKVLDCLKKIDGASHHLLSLVNDVLDMSCIESGKIQMNHAPFDIKKMLDECCFIISGQLVNRKVELIRDYNDIRHFKLIGDELHLRQIFINILGNSVKFTRDGDKIIVHVKELAEREGKALYRFELEDTGIGMSKDYLPRLFDEFSQENEGSRTVYRGTGLGMAIAKRFLDMLGGTIEVDSQLHVGTKFTIELWMDINMQNEPDIPEVNTVIPLTGMNILLVEDNELNAEIAKDLLEEEGATVTIAENGKEAVNIFRESSLYSYNIILMDIMMPEMDGLSATRFIRNMERSDAACIPIIAMTANAYNEDEKQGIEAGMNDFLKKPLIVKDFMKTLEKYL